MAWFDMEMHWIVTIPRGQLGWVWIWRGGELHRRHGGTLSGRGVTSLWKERSVRIAVGNKDEVFKEVCGLESKDDWSRGKMKHPQGAFGRSPTRGEAYGDWRPRGGTDQLSKSGVDIQNTTDKLLHPATKNLSPRNWITRPSAAS
jgi:hypothetical protein